MIGRQPIFLQANLRGREIGQLLDIDQAIDPKKRSAMTNRILPMKFFAPREKLSAARRVHDPIRLNRDVDTVGFEVDCVRAGFAQRNFQV